jgi:hypothetical protein
MKKILFAIAIALVVTIVSSCRKYEEGPMISFRSRTSRVANDWTVKSVYVNAEEDAANAAVGKLFTFTKEGRFTINNDSTGKWRFLENAEIIYLKFDDKVTTKEYTISKLKEKELWMYYYDSTAHKIELRME